MNERSKKKTPRCPFCFIVIMEDVRLSGDEVYEIRYSVNEKERTGEPLFINMNPTSPRAVTLFLINRKTTP